MPTGRVQVTAPVDREEEERQNQRMYRPAEGSVTRTSEAIGEITTPQKKKFRQPVLGFFFWLHERQTESEQLNLCFPSTDARAFGESSCLGVDTETSQRADCCHRAAAPEDHRFAEW